jgi:putative DNA primase/helicase
VERIEQPERGQQSQEQSGHWSFLSSGELGLKDHMAKAGVKVRGGQEVRCLDIDADSGKGLGLFENIHGSEKASTFAEMLTNASTKHYGAAGRMFVGKIANNVEKTRSWVRAQIKKFIDEQCRKHNLKDVPGEVFRALSRFALVAVAGELATELKITGWDLGASKKAAIVMFRSLVVPPWD